MRTITYTDQKLNRLTLMDIGILISKPYAAASGKLFFEINDVLELDSIIADLQDLRLTMKPKSERLEKL